MKEDKAYIGDEIVEGNILIAETDADRLIKMGYAIMDGGFIKGKRGEYLKLQKKKTGYVQLNIGRLETQETFLVHRLVAQLYVANPNNLPEVNHDNGIKDCNWSWNLKWSTRPDNIQHGFDTGLIPKEKPRLMGKMNNRSKPVTQKLNGLLIAEYESTGDAERKTGFDRTSIQDACKGRLKTYKTFTWEYNNQNKQS